MLWNAIIKKCVHYFFLLQKNVVFSRYFTNIVIYIKMLTAIKSGPRSCGQMYDVR